MANNNSNMPWYNMFPHSEFSIRNIDWLIKKYGEYDYRIGQIEESDKAQNETLEDHETRITNIESDIDGNIKPRIEVLESTVSGLASDASELREDVDANTSDIGNINGAILGINNDITALENADTALDGRLDSAEDRLTTLENGQSTIDSNIEELTREVNGLSNDVSGIDSRVTDLEGHSVVANPGGGGITLNTLAVDGTVYSVPQGGSGGGSSVTPNPTGTPIGDLTAIDIDGSIFSIPTGIDTSDMIADDYDTTRSYYPGDFVTYGNYLYKCLDNTSGAWDSTKWVRTACTSLISDAQETADRAEEKIDRIGAGYVDMTATTLNNAPNVQTKLSTLGRTLTPGVWFLTFNAKFDTSNYGSRYREIDCYIRDTTSPNNEFTIADNQFTIWGTEAASITAAAVTDCFGFISVAEGQTRTVVPAVNCRPSSGSQTYDAVGKFSCVCIKATA